MGRGLSQQGSHPNRWMELADGWSIKTVYKSTLVHQQCPIAGVWADLTAMQLPQTFHRSRHTLGGVCHLLAPLPPPPAARMHAGWLFKKLYGRLPADSDRAPMYDPQLGAEFRFDVSFIAAGGWVGGQGCELGVGVGARGTSSGCTALCVGLKAPHGRTTYLCVCDALLPATCLLLPSAVANPPAVAAAAAAANVHYITGKAFGGWMREAGLQAGEQIRMRRDIEGGPGGGRVLIQRVPAEKKVGGRVGG